MRANILNRPVVIGAIVFGVLNVVVSIGIIYGLFLLVYGRDLPSLIVCFWLVAIGFWFASPTVVGWLVARASMTQTQASTGEVTENYATLRGMLTIAMGQALFLFYLIILGPSVGGILIILTLSFIQSLLGGLGGALYSRKRTNLDSEQLRAWKTEAEQNKSSGVFKETE